MTGMPHRDDLFIAEYTLGLLDPQQAAQAHALLNQDYSAVIGALQWEERFLGLVDELTPLTPPDGLLGRIRASAGLPAASAAPARPAAPLPIRPATQPAPSADFEPRLIRPERQAAPQPAQPFSATAAKAAEPAASGIAAARRHASQPALAPRPADTAGARVSNPQPNARPVRKRSALSAAWHSLGFWRAACAILAAFAVISALPARFPAPRPADAAMPHAATPPPVITQVAILQAPGLSSTPGWVLTLDSRQNVTLAPKVDIDVPDTDSVYLWTHNETETQPRLLGVVDPTQALTLPASVTGQVSPGQIFEMTQEPNAGGPPPEPEGPVLFIGRTVRLG